MLLANPYGIAQTHQTRITRVSESTARFPDGSQRIRTETVAGSSRAIAIAAQFHAPLCGTPSALFRAYPKRFCAGDAVRWEAKVRTDPIELTAKLTK